MLDAAEQSFAANGYAATRIKDICTAAGATKSLFYWYFPTKRDLYIDLVRTRRFELRHAQAAAMRPDDDPLTQIRHGSEASVRFMTAHASYFAQIRHEKLDPDIVAAVSKGNSVYLSDVERLVQAGQDAGTIIDELPRLLAIGVINAVSSFSDAWRRGVFDVDTDQLAAFVGRHVVRTLSRGADG